MIMYDSAGRQIHYHMTAEKTDKDKNFDAVARKPDSDDEAKSI